MGHFIEQGSAPKGYQGDLINAHPRWPGRPAFNPVEALRDHAVPTGQQREMQELDALCGKEDTEPRPAGEDELPKAA